MSSELVIYLFLLVSIEVNISLILPTLNVNSLYCKLLSKLYNNSF